MRRRKAGGALLGLVVAASTVAPAAAEEDLGSLRLQHAGKQPVARWPSNQMSFSELADMRPTDRPIRVGIVSSGLADTVFRAKYWGQLHWAGPLQSQRTDPVGIGTYVTGVVLSLAPQAHVTVFSVYPDGKFNGGWLPGALDHFRLYQASFDVILLAFPPTEFADPVSAAMAAGEWEVILSAIEENPLSGASGPVYGAP